MGLFNKFKKAVGTAFTGHPLSYFAKQEGTMFHEATCDVCAGSFAWLETAVVYPVAVHSSRIKPPRSVLDIGGWCSTCNKMLCPKEADFVAFTIKTEDFWVTGCRTCQVPLHGRSGRATVEARRERA